MAGRGLIRRCSANQRKEAATSPLSASSHGLLITASALELLAAVRPTAFTIGNCTFARELPRIINRAIDLLVPVLLQAKF